MFESQSSIAAYWTCQIKMQPTCQLKAHEAEFILTRLLLIERSCSGWKENEKPERTKHWELYCDLRLQTLCTSVPGTGILRDKEEEREQRDWEKRKARQEGKVEIVESEGRRWVHKQTETGKGERGKEEGMTERDRQKEREISAGTVTNKSLQHDRRLLKHFISPQHNGVLLPIICSVSARVDIKWGAAAFSCHFSAVSPLPWRCGCFFAEPGCKQQGCWGVNGAGRGGQGGRAQPSGLWALQDSHCQHPITTQRRLTIGSVCCSDFHRCSQMSLHRPAFLITLHPSLLWWQQSFLHFYSSAAAPWRLLDAMMNWASQRPLSILRNINIPKIWNKKLRHDEAELSPLPSKITQQAAGLHWCRNQEISIHCSPASHAVMFPMQKQGTGQWLNELESSRGHPASLHSFLRECYKQPLPKRISHWSYLSSIFFYFTQIILTQTNWNR